MKKLFVFLNTMFLISSFASANDTISIKENFQSINAEYQELMVKEAEKVEEFKVERENLQEELNVLKEKFANKENILTKLEKDSQIRWHRDKYKKLLNNYKKYYKKLEKKISNTEIKINELNKLLEIIQ